jgi:N-acetylneuraminate synthase
MMESSSRAMHPGNADISIYEIMERCSLNESDELSLKKYVEKGMIFYFNAVFRAAANRLK